jgi:hypothetical protein
MSEVTESMHRLRAIAEFVPELEGDDVPSAVHDDLQNLIQSYPHLSRYDDYLTFLSLTAGAFVTNSAFSLGLYGFVGNAVPSFDEPRLFLDRGRFFHFGDVMYPPIDNKIYVLAFDLSLHDDSVLVTEDEVWEYTAVSPSFAQLLSDFARGRYPMAGP